MCVHAYVSLCLCVSVSLCLPFSHCPSFFLSLLCFSSPISLAVCLSLSVCLPACLSACLSVWAVPSIRLSVSLSLSHNSFLSLCLLSRCKFRFGAQQAQVQLENAILGGRFDPEKIFSSPPPLKFPQFAADTLPAPRPLPDNPPPSLDFKLKAVPPPTWRLRPPLSPPRTGPKKKTPTKYLYP